jgi:PTH1 family peptidyl-tRNA hydrolase
MNYLIVGLGNIGDEYQETRHNIGFKVVDALAGKNNSSFTLDRLAHYSSFKTRGKTVHLIKPTTYMNLSGKAVRYWMQELKIPAHHMLVVLDDLAIPFGTLRMKAKGSDGGHNGLKDIDATLGDNNYPRLRFGIGNAFQKGTQVSYVLGKWTVEEMKELHTKIDLSCDAINSFMFEGLERAMNKYNTK